MPAVATCPACRQSYHVPDQAAGQSVPCPRCGQILQSPPPSSPARPPASPPSAPAVPVTVTVERADRQPRRAQGGSVVALLFWIVALVWIVWCLLAIPLARATEGPRTDPLWLIANVVCAVGLATVVDRLCSWQRDG